MHSDFRDGGVWGGLDPDPPPLKKITHEPISNKKYKLASAPVEDSDQTAYQGIRWALYG